MVLAWQVWFCWFGITSTGLFSLHSYVLGPWRGTTWKIQLSVLASRPGLSTPVLGNKLTAMIKEKDEDLGLVVRPMIPVGVRRRQEDSWEFQPSGGYRVRLCLKIKRTTKLQTIWVVYTYNHNTREAEAGGAPGVRGQLGLYSEILCQITEKGGRGGERKAGKTSF